MHAALQVEAKLDLLLGRIEGPDRQADDGRDQDQSPADVFSLLIALRDDGFLALVSDDRRARDLDAHVVGDLQLHGLIVQLA